MKKKNQFINYIPPRVLLWVGLFLMFIGFVVFPNIGSHLPKCLQKKLGFR
jgi:hypothetical protein